MELCISSHIHIGLVNSLNTLSTSSESLLRLMSIFMTELFRLTKLFDVAWVHVETWNLPTSIVLLISDQHTWIQLELRLFNEQALLLLTNLALHQLVVRNFLNLATVGTKDSAHLKILSVAEICFLNYDSTPFKEAVSLVARQQQ